MKQIVVASAAVAALAGGLAVAGPKDITTMQLKDLKWQPLDPKDTEMKGPKMSVVTGDIKKGPVELILWVPPGFKPGPHTHTSDDFAVIIQGTVHNFKSPGTDQGPGLTAGGWWHQPGGEAHDNWCEESSKDGCVLALYLPKGFDFKPWVEKAAPKK
jgi:hypothetical protein